MLKYVRKFVAFFILISSVVFIRCESNEELIKEHSLSTKNLKVSEEQLDVLLETLKFKEAFLQIPRIKNKFRTKLQSKTAIEEDFGFTILSNLVRIVERNGYTYYTMFIEKEGSSIKDVDNFIIKLNDNGEMEAYLSKYKDILIEGKTFETTEKEFELIYSNRTIAAEENGMHCIYSYNLMCNNNVGTSGYYAHDHSLTSACTSPEYYYLSVDRICFPNGSDGSNNSNEGNSNGNTVNTSGNTAGGSVFTNNSNNGIEIDSLDFEVQGIVSSPIIQHHYSTTSNMLGLTPSQIIFINQSAQQEFLNSIMNYLMSIGANTFEDTLDDETRDLCIQSIIQTMQNPTVFNSITPFLIEKNIDDSQLDPCSKSVFQKIKNTTNCDFANVFAKLGANGTIYNTTLKTEHNNDINGNEVTDPANTTRTIQGVKYDYTVYVNPDYSGKTKLYIAAFLLHEMAHTYFFSLLDDYNTGVSNSFNELPILYNALVTNHMNFNPSLTHEEIANSYVNAISAALKEFQPGLSQQVYDDLAWSGLEKTDIFNTLHPQGSGSRERILNRKAAEQTGNPIGQGTQNQQNPLGQPCN